ncbi:MFS transporter [Sphingobacteriaceae bacterium]|nr:MFS transporter [Sphingobacteriaceae bacterium]
MITRTVSLYKTSFTGLSSQTWLLSFIMLINRSGTMVVPFMTLYLTGKTMNRTLAEAGTVMGLFGLGSIVGAYFGGKFSDKIGFFKIQLFTLIFGGLLFIILGQIKSYPLICLFTFLLSAVNEAFRPANSSAIAFYSKPENRTRSYSLNRLAINLGWAVGASLGGFIASYNYELLFWVDGFTNIFAAILLFIFLRPAKIEKKVEVNHAEVPPAQSAYRDKTYLWFIFLVTIFGLCFFQMFTTIPKYWRDNLFLSENYIGFIMAVNGLIIVGVEMVLVYILEQKKRTVFFISLGTFVCAVSFFSLLLPGNAKYVTLFMILLITVGEIISMPFMNSFWISRSNETNRGQYAALYTIAWGLGQTFGPFLCSNLVEATNFETLFIVLGVALLIAAFGFTRLTMKKL